MEKIEIGKTIKVRVPANSTNHIFNYFGDDLKCGSIYYDVKGDQYGGETLEGNYKINETQPEKGNLILTRIK